MKKTTIMLLAAILLLVVHVQPAAAASDFLLVNGQLTAQDQDLLEDDHLLKDFFKGLQISAVYSSQPDKYALSGTNSVEKSGQDGDISYVGNCSGDITGMYDSLTGSFDGTFHYEMSETSTSGGITMTNVLYDMDGEFTAIGNPDDTQIKITFHGVNKRLQGYTKEYFFDVTFAVQGALPFTQEPTDAAEEIEDPDESSEAMLSTTKHEDSGARFSDFSGQVEVLIPTGYDDNGEPIFDEEAWTFAKLDMPLPVNARIKTSDRSSVILSFADMTTFVMKPESEIILSSPSVKDSQFKLLVGTLWVNVKKMMKDGSMDIEMSQAVSGIKGTTLVLEDNGETSTLKVIEGTVEFTYRETGESVMVSAGEMIRADQVGLSEIQAFDVKQEQANWIQPDAQAQLPQIQPQSETPSGQTGRLASWMVIVFVSGVCLVSLILIALVAIILRKRSSRRTIP